MDDWKVYSRVKPIHLSSKTQNVLSIVMGGLLLSEVHLFPRCEEGDEDDEKADLDDEPFFDMMALGLNDLLGPSRPPP